MSNNKAASTLAFLAALALLMTACSPRSQPGPAGVKVPEKEKASGEAPRYKVEIAKQRGGKVTVPQPAAFGNPNDPHLTSTATGYAYSMPVTNLLVKRDIYDEKKSIVGDLAKSWEVSKDGLTYTFRLREGVKFHNAPPVNGREFTSEDAKYSLMRLTADPSVVIDKWVPRFSRRLDFGSIKSIDTPDKYTLVVNLKEPYAPFMDAVAYPGTQMLAREFVERFPDKIILEGMIGTGPFMPVEYRNLQLATYSSNPNYWNKDSESGRLPYLDELTFLRFADEAAELAAFRARQIDTTSGRKQIIEGLRRDMAGIQLFVARSPSLATFRFNMKFKPFQDVRVRKAVSLAVDRQQFLDMVFDGEGELAGPATPMYADVANSMDWLFSQPGYRKDKAQDIEEAKRLLKEAGYDDGLTVTVTGHNRTIRVEDVLALITDQLKPLKITVKGEVVDYAGQWVPRATQGDFEILHITHAMSTDVDSVLSVHVLTNGGRNYGKYSDPTLDELIKKQRVAQQGSEERKKWAQEAEKRILEQAPMIFMHTSSSTTTVQPWLHNYNTGAVGTSDYYERAWVEKR